VVKKLSHLPIVADPATAPDAATWLPMARAAVMRRRRPDQKPLRPRPRFERRRAVDVPGAVRSLMAELRIIAPAIGVASASSQ
jgi:hypothetical protein